MAKVPTYDSPQPQVPSPTAPPEYHAQATAHASLPSAGFYPPPAAHVPPPPMAPAEGIAVSHAPGMIGQWSTGLFDCFEDVGLCFITYWCPCVTFGQIAEIVDRGSTSCGSSGALYAMILAMAAFIGCPGLQCVYSFQYRSKMRAQYDLPEEPCIDCCVHCWCECCALCQEYRELRNRGFDMNIGWQGNMQRLQVANTATVPPPAHGGMMR